MFYKIKTLKIPEYLYYLIPNDRRTGNTRNLDFVETFAEQMYPYFPYSISSSDLHNAKSYPMFRKYY